MNFDLLTPILKRLDDLEFLIKQQKNQTNKLMSLKNVVEYSHLSESTIRRAIKRGKLKPFKDQGKRIFQLKDVNRWLNG